MSAEQRSRGPWWNPGWSWKAWLVIAAMVLPTVAFTAWVGLAARGESDVDADLLALARENAGGGEVVAIRGPEHTAYHALAPLPTEAQPRADGRPTLVFFSAPACRACEQLQFAHRVMAELRGRLAFVEKSVDREPAAERYGVRETPLFMLIDAQGRELGRFGTVPDAAAFRAEVERLLAAAGGG